MKLVHELQIFRNSTSRRQLGEMVERIVVDWKNADCFANSARYIYWHKFCIVHIHAGTSLNTDLFIHAIYQSSHMLD